MPEITPDIAFFLIFVGVAVRMVTPFLRKRSQSDEPFEWNHRYTWATAFSLAVAFAATVIGFVAYIMPDPEAYWLVAYAQTMSYGFSLEAIVVEVMEWAFPKTE